LIKILSVQYTLPLGIIFTRLNLKYINNAVIKLVLNNHQRNNVSSFSKV